MKATDIIKNLSNSLDSAREHLIQAHLDAEHLPAFISHLKSITVVLDGHTLVYEVMPDYLCLGEDDDYIHIPMTPPTAKAWMEKHGYSLPTKTMVDQIYKQSEVKVRPITWDELMKNEVHKHNRDATETYVMQSKKIQSMFQGSVGSLVAGHKKDVVLSNALSVAYRGNVAIYGWFNRDGSVIQGLNPISHKVYYVDYSHGLRMVANKCKLDGYDTTLQDIWKHPKFCKMLHDEPLKFMSY